MYFMPVDSVWQINDFILSTRMLPRYVDNVQRFQTQA